MGLLKSFQFKNLNWQMEQDFKYISKRFNDKYDEFFKMEQHKTIENSFYALGVLLRSNHLKYKNIRPYNPKDLELLEFWDLEVWMKVTWGTDDQRDEEIYEEEFEKAMLNGISQYDYMISNAVKYNRPAWCMFGLIGMIQGCLNQNQFKIERPKDIFAKEDYIRCLSYLSPLFIQKYRRDLEFLFSYFDERNYQLCIDEIGEISIKITESPI
jgi:hypothetical protein